ncbi:hypothetical protein EV128_13720 [Rhizobium azibense]|nr:hypothetical protein EV128_13720 [Rhizobium azibense]
MPLGWVHKLIPATGQQGVVACAFEVPLDCRNDVSLGPLDLIGGEYCRFDGTIRHRFQNLEGDSAVDPDAANADTKADTHMSIIAAALISMGVAFCTAVKDAHHSATAAASHQSRQKSTAATR